MTYDHNQVISTAFYGIAEVTRILCEALEKKQRFSVNINAGIVEKEPEQDCAAYRLDGSCDIHIVVEPFKIIKEEPLVIGG